MSEVGQWLATIGLLMDIVGVILLFRYGLPEKLDRDGANYRTLEHNDQKKKSQAALYDGLSYLALGLLVVGFAFQILAIWM